jgi:hypothetical protein
MILKIFPKQKASFFSEYCYRMPLFFGNEALEQTLNPLLPTVKAAALP